MKFKNKISYITLTLLLFSCSESKWAEETIIDPTIKENAIELSAEVQEKSLDFIHAKNMNVYNDSILIILNKPNDETKFVEFYNLNTNKKIADYIGRGNANNEMLMCISHLDGNKYIVEGFAKKKIAIINLDSVISNPNYKIPELLSYSMSSQFITPYGDDDYIF
ncbi:MAG: hypothetical protein IMY73_04305, partial [Bacteroidetes bacterium]|nr:hypothetical protein [Bacteroidota bacterium]